MLNNLYRPLEEGTHTADQITNYLVSRRNKLAGISSSYMDDYEFDLRDLKKKIASWEKTDPVKGERYNKLINRVVDDYKCKYGSAYCKNMNRKRGFEHRAEINKNIKPTKVPTNNNLKYGMVPTNNNLKYGIGATIGTGALLGGLYKYAEKHPDSMIGKKLAALKEKFKRK
jgi:hypothetical protein